LAPKCIYVSGKGTSGVGLTASAEKDEFGEGWVLKAGAMVLASGGQVNIDEIDKMDENDRVAMHEALESGQISVAKAGIVTTFKAKTAVLAAANPKLGRFNPNEPPASQFDLSPTLQSIDYSEPIIVRKNGKIKVAKMGEIIDEYYKGFSPEFSEPVYITDLDVPSFDPKNYKISWSPVQYVFRHKLETKMLEVRLETGRKVKITEGHSIFVLENGKVVPKKGNDIRVGDFAAIPKKLPENIETKNEINLIDELLKLPESKTSGIYLHNVPVEAFGRVGNVPLHWAKRKIIALKYGEFLTPEEKRNCTLKTAGGGRGEVPAIIPIDSRLMRFLGYYIAEGSMFITGSKEHLISLAFGAHENLLHADVAKICSGLFNHQISKILDRGNGMKVNIANKIVFLLFNDILKLSRGAKTKEVPEIVFNYPMELQKEFLRAYHAGDYCATVSEKLASDVLYLLLQNDVLASIHEWQPKNTFIKGRKINPSRCYSLVDAKQKILKFKSTKPYLRVPLGPFKETLKSLSMSNFSGNLRGKNKPLKRLTNNILDGRLSNKKLKMKTERMMKFESGPLSLAEFIAEIDHRPQTLNVIETYRAYLNRLEKRGMLEKVRNSNGTVAYQISKLGAVTIENYKNLKRLSIGDLGFAKIKAITEVKPTTDFVYDVSTPGCENFIAGFGGVICHNSRFDLIFPIKDVLDENRDRKLAEHILKGHMYSADNDNKDSALVPPIDLNILRKYIAYARKNYSPALSQEASEKIKEFYLKLRRLGEKQNNYPVTARQIEGLIRLSEASAKMRLSSIVESSDADRAINLTEYVLQNVFMDKETGRIDSD
ncbi:MAG: ATP-binding protein, partial [Candidatus Micrarchaeota archaeon]